MKPKVSVTMITYGHGKYIKEAIEGVLMQVCDFEVELIVANDKSPDNTEVVVMDIIKNHPNGHWIKYTRHEDNKGMIPNFMWSLEQCKGKYIALCEGDDYWTDPLKLQKQVDFLECNQDYSFSMSRVDVLIEKTKEIKKRKELVNPTQKEYFTLRDYLKSPFSQTSSFMFKNDDFDFPSWTAKTHAGDQTLVVLKTGLKGKIKYHEECFSIYRLNENSISFKAKYDVYEKFIETLGYWHEYLNYEYTTIFTLRKWKTRTQSNYSKHNVGLLMKIYTKIKLRLIDVLLKIV